MCKRQLHMGKEGGLSSAECRTRLKKWLLLGIPISQGPEARTDHFKLRPRPLDISEGEAEMDVVVEACP